LIFTKKIPSYFTYLFSSQASREHVNFVWFAQKIPSHFTYFI